MKATGMVRRVDNLGRVVVPKELRDALGWQPETPLEIYVDGSRVVLEKYERGCVFCGKIAGEYRQYMGKSICPECYKLLANGATGKVTT